jgi:transcriptional regulator with XRE-family HTH domain
MRTKFAENFSAILKIRDISQTQFAKLYGVKQNTVSQWANGKREPTFHDLCCICTLLNVDFKEILGYNPRTKEAILRDIIGGHDDFQKEQRALSMQMYKDGHSNTEINIACNELYQKRYNEYKKVFGFED